MQSKLFLFLLAGLAAVFSGNSQTCSALGQTPARAFPVCGTDTFRQTVVGICGSINILTQCRDGASYQDKNPYWYKFTCFTAGTLAFTIRPFNQGDDYDWQLFDITNRNPADVFTDASLFVSCNWSSNPGNTGTAGSSNGNVNCAGPSYPNFNAMPVLQFGHQYILMVSHYTDSQEGYFLSFTGGTANITDPKLPALQTAEPDCQGQVISLKLNKKMKCNSISPNGSDFILAPAAAAIASAVGVGCSSSFDTDSVTLTLASPLPSGNYFLVAKNGSDGNTLFDNCDRTVPIGDQLPFRYIIPQPIRADSIEKPLCAPNQLKVYFPKKISCASITPAGTDFTITGPTSVGIISAAGLDCSTGASNVVVLQFNSPIYTRGTYTLLINPGIDGSPVLDACGQPILPQSISFTTSDTVSADFTYNLALSCKQDAISVKHDGRNGVNQWNWLFDGIQTRTTDSETFVFSSFGTKTIQLAVSNGVCKDSASITILLDNELKAAFTGTDLLCPADSTLFKDNSTGKIVSWNWNFGNGNSSILKDPPAQVYPLINLQRTYQVKLIVTNNIGCSDTVSRNLTAVANCFIAVPSGFTPDGDGLNDFLYPLNAYKADRLEFKVYNRYGQLVWQTRDWTRKWDGRINGQLLGTQTFIWTLSYTNRDTGIPFNLKGTTTLIR